MTDRPDLKIVQPAWNRSEAYRPDPIQMLRDRVSRRPPLLERIVRFFESDRGAGFAWGFYSGAMFTVFAAFVWGLFLK